MLNKFKEFAAGKLKVSEKLLGAVPVTDLHNSAGYIYSYRINSKCIMVVSNSCNCIIIKLKFHLKGSSD